jgi:hypothetical protein
MDGKGPSQAGGVGASRGKSRQSGSKVRPFPLCRGEHRAEHFLSGVVAVSMSEFGRHHHRIGGVEPAVCIFVDSGEGITVEVTLVAAPSL